EYRSGPGYSGPREEGIMFQDWILTEDIDVLVTTTEPELLVSRVFGPGAVLLRMNSEGIITANGQSVDLGDDASGYWGIFDHVTQAANNQYKGCLAPPVGFHCEMPAETSDDSGPE